MIFVIHPCSISATSFTKEVADRLVCNDILFS